MVAFPRWRGALVLLLVLLLPAAFGAGRTSADDPASTPDRSHVRAQVGGAVAVAPAVAGAAAAPAFTTNCAASFGAPPQHCHLWEGLVTAVSYVNDRHCPGPITFTYNWGDADHGDPNPVETVAGTCDGTAVFVPHLYQLDEKDTVRLIVTQTDPNEAPRVIFNITFTEGDILLSDPTQLPENPITIEPNTTLDNKIVAYFKHVTYPENQVSDFTATIDWGDKTPPYTGTINAVSGDSGDFTVSGTHTYKDPGPPDGSNWKITVTIQEDHDKKTDIAKATTPTTALEIVDKATKKPIQQKNPQKTVVGKHVQLQVKATDGTKVTDIDWDKPDNTVEHYDVEHGVDPTPIQDFTKATLSFYWLRPDDYTIKVTGKINGRQLNATASVIVAAPNVAPHIPPPWCIDIHSPSPHDHPPLWYLKLGFNLRCPAVQGIRFTFVVQNPPAGFPQGGQFALTQFININADQASGPIGTFTTDGQFLFDNSTFYHNHQIAVPGTYTDAAGPALPLCHPAVGNTSWAVYTGSFQTYWLFRPTGSDSIWVPLGEVRWGFAAHADGMLRPPDATHPHPSWAWTIHPGFTDPNPTTTTPVDPFTVAGIGTFTNPALPGCDAS